jgi:hypothetical protein
MALYSYNFQDKKRDLSDVLSTIVQDEPPLHFQLQTCG